VKEVWRDKNKPLLSGSEAVALAVKSVEEAITAAFVDIMAAVEEAVGVVQREEGWRPAAGGEEEEEGGR
jgi:hypothetical protein